MKKSPRITIPFNVQTKIQTQSEQNAFTFVRLKPGEHQASFWVKGWRITNGVRRGTLLECSVFQNNTSTSCQKADNTIINTAQVILGTVTKWAYWIFHNLIQERWSSWRNPLSVSPGMFQRHFLKNMLFCGIRLDIVIYWTTL